MCGKKEVAKGSNSMRHHAHGAMRCYESKALEGLKDCEALRSLKRLGEEPPLKGKPGASPVAWDHLSGGSRAKKAEDLETDSPRLL